MLVSKRVKQRLELCLVGVKCKSVKALDKRLESDLVLRVLTVAKQHREFNYGSCEHEVLVRLACDLSVAEIELAELADLCIGLLVADSELDPIRSYFLGFAILELELVADRQSVSRADLACVLGIVVKVLVCEHTVLVADKAVLRNAILVKGKLELYVLCDSVDGGEQGIGEDALCLCRAVDIVINAVARLSDSAHIRVTEVARAKAENREEYAALALVFNKLFKLLGIADAYVKITVGCKDNSVITSFYKIFFCKFQGFFCLFFKRRKCSYKSLKLSNMRSEYAVLRNKL